MRRIKLSVSILLFGAVAFCGVPTDLTNTTVISNGKSLYGEDANGQGVQLIGVDSAGGIVVNSGAKAITINGTIKTTGALSLGSTIAVDNILEKTSAHGVSIDGVLVKDGGANIYFGGNGSIATPNINFSSNSGVYGHSGVAGLSTAGSWKAELNGSGIFETNGTVSGSALSLSNPVRVRATLAAGDNVTVNNAQDITVTASTEAYDSSSAYTNGVFTAPSSGLYLVYLQTQIGPHSASGTIWIYFSLTGEAYSQGYQSLCHGVTNGNYYGTAFVRMSAGDTLVPHLENKNGSAVKLAGGLFKIEKVN